jgi:UDP-N-acetyl-alpha-D-quinovosamine dehydrogenase
MKVLVTGASGFIGRRLVTELAEEGHSVVSVVRPASAGSAHNGSISVEYVDVLDDTTNWSHALDGVSCIVHCASVAHGNSGNVRAVNVAGALNLARQAADAGVQRLVFLSSIGVNGNVNSRPFTEDDTPRPIGMYAESKWEAEQGLLKIQNDTGIQVVILRPPLVYGPHAPGNFGSLVRWTSKGVPLPLGAVHNKRSLVALDNLVDLIVTCVEHPAAANEVFLAGDGQDLSTTELLRGVGQAMGKPARLVPVPPDMLMLGASLLGKKTVAQRLLGSLQVDISKARNVLGWEPPITVEEGLRRCFISENGC